MKQAFRGSQFVPLIKLSLFEFMVKLNCIETFSKGIYVTYKFQFCNVFLFKWAMLPANKVDQQTVLWILITTITAKNRRAWLSTTGDCIWVFRESLESHWCKELIYFCHVLQFFFSLVPISLIIFYDTAYKDMNRSTCWQFDKFVWDKQRLLQRNTNILDKFSLFAVWDSPL